MQLSILILTTQNRIEFLSKLLENFTNQIGTEAKMYRNGAVLQMAFPDIEILIHTDNFLSVGKKRNELLEAASGKYLCFFDDDDEPAENYISTLRTAMYENPDCVSLRGIMTTNGSNPEIFEHSLKYKSWQTTKNKIKYERYPNHLNCIRTSIARQFKFPEKNFGEDFDWSKQLHESGLLKTEYYTETILYHYLYRKNK